MRKTHAAAALGATLLTLTACSPPEPEVRTVTRTVEVEVVPAVCLDALAAADAAFDVNARAFDATAGMFDASSTALQAVLDGDLLTASSELDRMERGNADLDALTAELDMAAYAVAREECRAVAR